MRGSRGRPTRMIPIGIERGIELTKGTAGALVVALERGTTEATDVEATEVALPLRFADHTTRAWGGGERVAGGCEGWRATLGLGLGSARLTPQEGTWRVFTTGGALVTYDVTRHDVRVLGVQAPARNDSDAFDARQMPHVQRAQMRP